ncbi:MAG: hypothetical protein COU82_00255 [Candidatus Portnoybacteria bacterium CG10_big_fil_rev_8_21_14_0_10_38_18]|uniref:Uncharacterized protein n=1 Tax=Candidatus Portnoybacteria bacterium CG10_big_fil_rev_8_21_14_0_10_38_18 TaxID=1974813 RepID=A0A2M8KCU4_9BACT|nr:MAG: hypothetical protein COU82_00255 [Candidatus Portnoybacteria bacterium CG10_big_fil_rev_8_21_14_0_10_38_18]
MKIKLLDSQIPQDTKSLATRIKQAGPIIRQLAIILVILVVAFLIARSIGGPLLFWSLFVWLTSKVSDTGVNIWLARTIVVPIALLLFYAIKFMFSRNRKKRSIGLILLCAFLCLGSLGMYYFTQDQYFNKWVGWGPNGYKLYPRPGLDEYGEKLQKVTPDIARQIEIWKKNKGELPKPVREKYQFFDYRTKRPIRWYYKYSNSKIEIFDQPGFHPTYQKPLLPVNEEIVQEYLKQLEQEEMQNAIPQKPVISEEQPTYAQLPKQIDFPKEELEEVTPTEKQGITELTTETENPENQKQLPDNYKETLTKYGNWVEDPDYNQVWVPNANKDQTDWMPYQNGTWQDYRDGTYLWSSYEPFGYITYHFGRWQWHPIRGWYWIPTAVWGPAWVEWYWSGDYAYWSPSHFDDRYYDSYHKYYYSKSDRKAWLGVHKNQLKALNLLQITRTKKTPSVSINPGKITPNAQMTNIFNPSRPLQSNSVPLSPHSESSIFRSLFGPRHEPASQNLQSQKQLQPNPTPTLPLFTPRSDSRSRTGNNAKNQIPPTIRQRQSSQPATIRKNSPPIKKQASSPPKKKRSRPPAKKKK